LRRENCDRPTGTPTPTPQERRRKWNERYRAGNVQVVRNVHNRFRMRNRSTLAEKSRIYHAKNADSRRLTQQRYRSSRECKRLRYKLIKTKNNSVLFKRRRDLVRSVMDRQRKNAVVSTFATTKIKKRAADIQRKLQLTRNINEATALRDDAASKFKYLSTGLRKIASEIVGGFPADNNINETSFLQAVGGSLSHTNYSEGYFWETSYTVCPQDLLMVIDEAGKVTNWESGRATEVCDNIPEADVSSKTRKSNAVMWSCYELCIIRPETIDVVAEFIKSVTVAPQNGDELLQLFQQTDRCDSSCRSDKKGHAISCVLNQVERGNEMKCKSVLRCIRELRTHYSGLRKFLRKVYKLKSFAECITTLDEALASGNMDTLRRAMTSMQSVLGLTSSEVSSSDNFSRQCTVEEVVIYDKYAKQLSLVQDLVASFCDAVCCCCERLHKKSDVRPVANFVDRTDFNNEAWMTLRAFILVRDGDDDECAAYSINNICDYCSGKLRANSIPPRFVLNGLETDPLPDELRDLNLFESIIIQKAKCFQTVLRLGTLSSKKSPSSELVKAVKGRVVYLPIPLQNNCNIIPKKLPEHDLSILVHGVPTKDRVIWRDTVSIHRVHAAIVKLGEINPLYDGIEFSLQDAELHVFPDAATEMQADSQAILQRLTETEANSIYEHYTVQPVSSKGCVNNLEEYTMQKVTGDPLGLWDRQLDLMCFPTLFPRGRFGKYEERTFCPLGEAEYRVSRLLNKDPRYRLDQQYLFHLLHDSEIKALSSSIAYMLRTKRRQANTVRGVLDQADARASDLERSLICLFSKMRGTKEYWYCRQGELLTYMRNFGPPHLFLTVSSAEYDWDVLIDHLRKINGHLPGVDKMSAGELCSMDPVTVSKHFHDRFHGVFHKLILSKENPPLGVVERYFYRVEYQARGCAHVHCLLWIRDAPVIGSSGPEEILKFVESHITCEKPDRFASPTLNRLVTKFQTHKCSSYCNRFRVHNGKFSRQCRFGFPRKVTATTMVNDVASSVGNRTRGNTSKRLYDIQRANDERFINDYNPVILLAHQANMDIQYVGECSLAIAR
jgi:hypothetical protein